MADIPHRPYVYEVALSAVGATVKFAVPDNATKIDIAIRAGSDPVYWNTDEANVDGGAFAIKGDKATLSAQDSVGSGEILSNLSDLASAFYFDLVLGGTSATVEIMVS